MPIVQVEIVAQPDEPMPIGLAARLAEELGAYIEGGYGRWAEFRDRLLKADG